MGVLPLLAALGLNAISGWLPRRVEKHLIEVALKNELQCFRKLAVVRREGLGAHARGRPSVGCHGRRSDRLDRGD